MTALTRYQRLEAPGLWRPAPEAQRRDVIVSVGDATLTITDLNDRALAHWSLPAVHRLNPRERPALFAPSDAADEGEELELADPEMIDAIETVRKAIDKARPRPGRLRQVLTLAVVALTVTFAVVWLPGALKRHTLSVLPDVTRAAVGDRLLTRVRRVAGTPCAGALGGRALGRLGTRVLGADAARLFVVSAGVANAGHLPGGIILLNRALVEDYEEPDVAAGFILAEAARAEAEDPMLALLDHAGLIATARLLTTGTLADPVLDAYAERLLTARPVPLDTGTLLARFAAARVRATPYAFALDQTGETTIALIEADPVPMAAAEPLLADADWVSLQGICLD
ncbi:MAG: hypothetical protein AUK37_05810 [Rhodobacterales bacterium CG2_30_65_12]|nr:MAG: hypothetical protein AUK37_05810 [Rhodobacterales bacterium CG2_30_65_12]